MHKTWGMIYLLYVSAKANMKKRPLGPISSKVYINQSLLINSNSIYIDKWIDSHKIQSVSTTKLLWYQISSMKATLFD